MDKEKEIEGMAKVIVNFKEKHDIPLGVGFHSVDLSKHIIEAGYRKAEDVRKETAKEIYERVEKWLDEIVPYTREETLLICLLGWIKTKYDVYNDFDEVDE